ncbi:MAG TPA: isovaleryl-CoA dehydrogenase [Burkholderiaceae bacterium]|nr:isovaleryl-CoA dehydrogenase [Burkholderiaceae bacterium]
MPADVVSVTDAEAARNQSPPLQNVNLYAIDRALQEGVKRYGAGWAEPDLARLGAAAAEPRTIELARLANRHPPVLHTHDRYGNRRDEVEFHPAYHELMAMACAAGLHSSPWAGPRPGAHVARAAGYLLYGQIENGTQCPLTMTFAATPLLAHHADSLPALRETWLPRLHARRYDERFAPIEEKHGATIGMGMTEKQGGSDVRSNLSRAAPVAGRGPGRPYRLHGHKWFMSAPMCDAFLLLAQAERGLSCFFVPRFVDGRCNALRFLRLKDKLGNRSNASSEVELDDATGYLMGDEGRGVPTILEMVNLTRLDCSLGTTGMMRLAVSQALHHARHRETFGRRLAEHDLMKNVLADLALEAEAATALALWLAHQFDAGTDPRATALRRVFTPAAKYWLCKRAAGFCQEAMEVLGGNGYVEDSVLPRLYREAPVNSIWEGSGNIMCLDVLRGLRREPETADLLLAELDALGLADPRIARAAAGLKQQLGADSLGEHSARTLTERLVLVLQSALLVGSAPAAVAEAFIAGRLDHRGGAYGTLPPGLDLDTVVERAWPSA